MSRGNAKSLSGQIFGRLKVIERCGSDKHGKALWKCKCGCGGDEYIIATTSQLTTHHTQSCGCLQKERTSQSNKNITLMICLANMVLVIHQKEKNFILT